jgi:hypothetical protein
MTDTLTTPSWESAPEGLHEYQQLKYLSLPGFHT